MNGSFDGVPRGGVVVELLSREFLYDPVSGGVYGRGV